MERAEAYPLPPRDPIGGGPLVITELEATDTGVTIRGRFEVPRFARLSPDQARYLETFLRCRGMLNSVERELGISYPTARARLDAVLKALDLHAIRETTTVNEVPIDEPHGFPDDNETETPIEGTPDVMPSAYEEPAADETKWDDVAETFPSFETPPEEVSTAPTSDGEAPTRSRDELLTLLEKGEITVDELKKELERTK